MSKYKYLINNRLKDVIRLISILAVYDIHSFRTEKGLSDSLRGDPMSAELWFNIAKEHPEFFRMNKDETSVVLLLRFLNDPIGDKDKGREPLTIDQTQVLIQQSITLHDKELSQYQMNSFRIPIYAALISSIIALIATCLTLYISSK